MEVQDFKHIQAAHCENGVTTNLLQYVGVNQISEPMAFGIGSGIFYLHIPFIKINNGPAIAFRSLPGSIFKSTCKSLKIPVIRKKFKSKEKAQQFLDEKIKDGQPVGCQVGVYHLPYFPKEYRFHFNAHNIVVYGKEGDNYLVSDPVMESVTTLTTYELERVRFARGALAPKGQIYYPEKKVEVSKEQICKAIQSGIKKNCFIMLNIPGPIIGVNGIKYTADKIKKWKNDLGLASAKLYLAQLVRMQEEIGTGGGGFRYIYAAFLQESHSYINNDNLLEASEMFTKAGDLWRSSAVQAAAIYRGRLGEQSDFNDMSAFLYEISEIERQAFKKLSKISWK